jgi:hypothetical protein
MASIQKELIIEVDAGRAWSALRDVAHVDRLFAGVLTSACLDGDVRTVTFANGLVVRERAPRCRSLFPFTTNSCRAQLFTIVYWLSGCYPRQIVRKLVRAGGTNGQAISARRGDGETRPAR